MLGELCILPDREMRVVDPHLLLPRVDYIVGQE